MSTRPSILYGKAASLTGRPTRRKRWLEQKEEHRLQCQRMGKSASNQQKEMAERSKGCDRRHPCGEGWCPQCMFRAQEKVFDHCGPALQKFLQEVQAEAQKNGDPIPQPWVVSAASAKMLVKRGHLSANTPRAVNSTLRKRLDSSDLSDAICFIGWDVSLNVRTVKLQSGKTKRKSCWQVHMYGIVFAANAEDIHKVFDPLFWHQLEKGDKPVKVYTRSPDDIPRTLRYALKPNFHRREPSLEKTGRRRPIKTRLLVGQKDELAVFLGDLGFKDRLFLRGVKLVRGTLIRTRGLPHQNKFKTQKDLEKRLFGASTGLFGPSRKK